MNFHQIEMLSKKEMDPPRRPGPPGTVRMSYDELMSLRSRLEKEKQNG